MKRKPIFYFEDYSTTGISKVPVGGYVLIGNRGDGLVRKLLVVAIDTAVKGNMTLRTYLTKYPLLYKDSDFDNKPNKDHIDDNTRRIVQNEKDVAIHRGEIDVNIREIYDLNTDVVKNETAIGYNRVQIDKNTQSIKNSIIDYNKQVKINKDNIAINVSDIDHQRQDFLALEGGLFDFITKSPEFGDGKSEMAFSLYPKPGQESHLSVITKDAAGKVNGFNWRLGDFVETGTSMNDVKLQTKKGDVILCVDSGRKIKTRIGGVYRDIQAVDSGATIHRPASPIIGQMYFDEDIDKPLWWDGRAWINAASDGGNAVYYISTNKGVMQDTPTIADLYRLMTSNNIPYTNSNVTLYIDVLSSGSTFKYWHVAIHSGKDPFMVAMTPAR